MGVASHEVRRRATAAWSGARRRDRVYAGPMAGLLRRIVVDGEPFRWRVSRIDGHWIWLRIWRGEQRPLWAEVRIRCDDGWLLLGDRDADGDAGTAAPRSVTPRQVADVVRAALASGGLRRRVELRDGQLVPIGDGG
jgi:hypothetical protein